MHVTVHYFNKLAKNETMFHETDTCTTIDTNYLTPPFTVSLNYVIYNIYA